MARLHIFCLCLLHGPGHVGNIYLFKLVYIYELYSAASFVMCTEEGANAKNRTRHCALKTNEEEEEAAAKEEAGPDQTFHSSSSRRHAARQNKQRWCG